MKCFILYSLFGLSVIVMFIGGFGVTMEEIPVPAEVREISVPIGAFCGILGLGGFGVFLSVDYSDFCPNKKDRG
ncbi:MAG: hypothetical protein A2826_02800 [Candidatus Doudnabacteria bacterium RIFCSPHIGHO2_01_FULL_43_23]|uniref:Uncharacterized protein n=1 Tax=Candidatus Doudnabacteria bacterium RIFCSPHIGHO2_01_FULL_43_23 TaxID=1817822 RepID=A0A1F5NSM8_9BACT|nr:MAG: hypothetical protein A2826_02800 [Candidatus Doudnabacteria bacterium RIFCSPHIGHO2_01_FULL_43_23]